MTTALATIYKDKAMPALKEQFGYKNINELPKISKIMVNIGTGRAKEDPKLKETMAETLKTITGQQPAVRKARKAISSFKVQQGQPVGLVVTLRGKPMEHFFEKLVRITLPRERDFRGLNPKAFDGRGNYSFGLKEQGVFPELSLEQIDRMHGLQITIITTAKTDKEGHTLLSELGMPFSSEVDIKELEEVTEEEDRATLLAHAKEKAGKTKLSDAT